MVWAVVGRAGVGELGVHPAIVGHGAHGVRDCEGDGADSEPKAEVGGGVSAFGAKTTRYGAKRLSARPA